MPNLVQPLPACVRRVHSWEELVGTAFGEGVNALCWERTLVGDYAEVVRLLGDGDGEPLRPLDAEQLRALPTGPEGRRAVEQMIADFELLRAHDLDPVLNCIHGYPRDEDPGPVVTDVFSFHADRAPFEASTFLCTYHGPSSEGLRPEDAVRRADLPATRAALLAAFGEGDGPGFREFLAENCYDLHYAPVEGAQPYVFGRGHLWRIATDFPGSPVPPCVHRAPDTRPGDPPRLLLIS
jgi:hypothetical protein